LDHQRLAMGFELMVKKKKKKKKKKNSVANSHRRK
jgi:hypothetical protein